MSIKLNVENIEFCIALSKLKSANVFAAIKTFISLAIILFCSDIMFISVGY